MDLRTQILDATKQAMRDKEKDKLAVLRMVTARIKDLDIKHRGDGLAEVNDGDILALLAKMVKQMRESVAMYQKGERADLVAQEEFQIHVVEGFLPQPLSDAEIDAALQQAISESKASSAKDMGAVMQIMKRDYVGRIDFSRLPALVKQKLS